jgi:hypothetical protein
MNTGNVASLVFYGNIPPDSSKDHLGIVLVDDGLNIKYCYCTSQKNTKERYNDYCYEIPEENMKVYFPNNATETYIILSQAFILKILRITFANRIDTGEFEYRGLLDENTFDGLIQAILDSDYISEEFKKAIIEYTY